MTNGDPADTIVSTRRVVWSLTTAENLKSKLEDLETRLEAQEAKP